MKNASQIPAIAEPWFPAFNASIEIQPVMISDDLAKASGAIDDVVKNTHDARYLTRGSRKRAGGRGDMSWNHALW